MIGRRSNRLDVSGPPWLIWIALVAILIVAALFRFYGLAWDSGYLFHPDERQILLVTTRIKLPSSGVEFFSADSPLNPKFFAYGSFPIYLLRVLGVIAPDFGLSVPYREDLVRHAMLGRTFSVLFDLGTIAFLFLLGRRLYGATVGLIAALCVALMVLHIQLAHFYTVDTLLTLLVVATLYFAARFAQMGKWLDAIPMSITFGLALATKISAAPLIVPIVVAVIHARKWNAESETQDQVQKNIFYLRLSMFVRVRFREIWSVRETLAKIVAVAFVAFIVVQPYALLDPIRYFGQLGTESLVARGWLDYPYTRQYANTLPFIYLIAQSSVWGMGLPLGIFAWGGSAIFLWRWWRKRDWNDAFVLSWAFVYFALIGGQYAKHLRYLLPLSPFLFLMMAASLKSQISDCRSQVAGVRSQVSGRKSQVARFTHHVSRLTLYVLRFTFCVSILFAFVYSFAFVGIYAREHSWLTISKWIYANVPANADMAVEHWDDLLPVPMRFSDAAHSPEEYRLHVLPMYDDDDTAKLQTLVETLAVSDYVILATQRLSATIGRLPQRYPISSRYYQLLFDGRLGFELTAFARNDITLDDAVVIDDRFDSGRPPSVLAQSDMWVSNWGRADESFTVYDHPLPLVFKKTRALSQDELRALLFRP